MCEQSMFLAAVVVEEKNSYLAGVMKKFILNIKFIAKFLLRLVSKEH